MKKLLLSALVAFSALAQAEKITIATEGTYPPFSYHDESGKLTGYDVEVARAVGEKLGIEIEFAETNWDSILAGLKAGRFDAVANQVFLNSDERKASFVATTPYAYSGEALVVHQDNHEIKGLEDVKGKKAGQAITSSHADWAKNAGAEILPNEGWVESVLLIEQKRADLTFNDELAVLTYLKANPKAPIKIVWTDSNKTPVGLTFQKDRQDVEKYSKAIEDLKADGTLKKIGEQFFGKDISNP
ncbi:MAG: transporter substrate-binding domain-containing protein [Cardiobacteriaceae bacterium]|nr:transporter substrate-binding domain-containing protein [Cardiobacteriaceae bacterium]